MNKAEIKDKELLEKINSLYEDKMSVFVMANGRVRGALFHGTRFVNQLRAQHNLGILETMVLGQASLCAALVVPMMKDMEHTVIKYETDGPAQGFSVEADSKGTVRGFLYNEHIPVTKPLENWDLSSFLGKGTITFSRVHKDDKYPQSSTVPVDSGNIAKDFALYFQQSEQIQTAFNTSIQFDKQGRVIGAGAMFLQIMPEVGGKKGSGANKSSQGNKEDDDISEDDESWKEFMDDSEDDVEEESEEMLSLSKLVEEVTLSHVILALFSGFSLKSSVFRKLHDSNRML